MLENDGRREEHPRVGCGTNCCFRGATTPFVAVLFSRRCSFFFGWVDKACSLPGFDNHAPHVRINEAIGVVVVGAGVKVRLGLEIANPGRKWWQPTYFCF